MKNAFAISTVALFTLLALLPLGDARADAALSIHGKGIEVAFDRDTGTWNAWTTVANERRERILADMVYGGDDFRSTDPDYAHSGEVRDIDDVFGKGRELTVRSRSREKQPTLLLRLRVYRGHGFITAGGGVVNTTGEDLRLQSFSPAIGTAFPEQDELPNLGFLTGVAGGGNTQVLRETPARSVNNLLTTFGTEGRTRSLMMGGLTYVDFQKTALVDRDTKTGRLRAELTANDPVGRRIDPGEIYSMPDLLYIDFRTDNPFEAAEAYGQAMRTAMDVRINYYTFPSICMWFVSVRHFGGDRDAINDTPGAVREMDRIADSGFLKYSPVAVRLVPDNYEANNEQGWWDDRHWQMYGRKERCIVEGGHYKKPYETTAKWCQAITERGGIPLTYIQPGVRSEDYAEAFPEHMLFNEPHRPRLGPDGKPHVERHAIRGGIYGILFQESYDYTDPGFLKHIDEVYDNLAKGGMKGIFYDYPTRACPARGGMEDKRSTASAAYRNVYRPARKALGPVCYLQERLAWGSDLATGLIDSQRTEVDTNALSQRAIRKASLRWYKNRTIVSYDMDGKALMAKGHQQQIPIEEEERRAILTMNYAVSARLLLTESFARMNTEVLHDLSRTIPYHATPLSARPVDAFVREYPRVFDFRIGDDWHQLILFNDDPKGEATLDVRLSGNTAFGAVGLDPRKSYYLYDFWNDRFIGKKLGDDTLRQRLRPGEARVLSVHAVLDRPQWIATDRHMMQGYVDLVGRPEWSERDRTLTAVSRLVEKEPYRVIVATNGHKAVSASAQNARATLRPHAEDPNLVVLKLQSDDGGDARWSIRFEKR